MQLHSWQAAEWKAGKLKLAAADTTHLTPMTISFLLRLHTL